MTHHISPGGTEKSSLLGECRRLPTTAGWRAGLTLLSQTYLSIIVTFKAPPHPLLSNRAVGRVLPVSLPSLLWRTKTEAEDEGGAVHSRPPDCGHWARSAAGTHSQPLLSDLPAPSARRAHTCPGGPQQKTHGAPRQHISEAKTTEIFCMDRNTVSTFQTSSEWHHSCWSKHTNF